MLFIVLIIRDYPGDSSSDSGGSDESGTDDEDNEEGGGSRWRKKRRRRENFFDDFIEAEFRKRRKVVYTATPCFLFGISYTFICSDLLLN